MAYYERERIEAISLGLITAEATAGRGQLVPRRRRPGEVHRTGGRVGGRGLERFDFLQATSDEALLCHRPRLSPDVRLVQHFDPAEGGWVVTRVGVATPPRAGLLGPGGPLHRRPGGPVRWPADARRTGGRACRRDAGRPRQNHARAAADRPGAHGMGVFAAAAVKLGLFGIFAASIPSLTNRQSRCRVAGPQSCRGYILPMPAILSDQPELEPLETAQRRRILIVDDDEALVELLSRRLQQQGYVTLTADTGHAGLALARREAPSLVILDLRLPDVNGFSICQQLVDAAETCSIPVIMLSGMERADIVRRCRAAGCTYFVRKPYDPNALLVLIRQAIGEAGRWTEVAE